MELEQLSRHQVNLHYDGICNFISFIEIELNLLFLRGSQLIRSVRVDVANASELAGSIGYLEMPWPRAVFVTVLI